MSVTFRIPIPLSIWPSCVTTNTKGIYLAHLSEECNTPELALRTYKETFIRKD
jgi:hypothetical protein